MCCILSNTIRVFSTVMQFSPSVLVLTHERAKAEEYATYLSRVLFPVRPLLCWGRAAMLSPKCEKEEAVRSWWKECRSSCDVHIETHYV
jgi:hypothetical protein